MQAGLGFDGALGKVTAKMKGPLIEEFERLLQELRMGVTRRNALVRLAKRCGIEEMKLFTAALIQAEKLGVGMAQVLEIQSENMREMRRQRAKEQAAKLPVKILFPTVIFIFGGGKNETPVMDKWAEDYKQVVNASSHLGL